MKPLSEKKKSFYSVNQHPMKEWIIVLKDPQVIAYIIIMIIFIVFMTFGFVKLYISTENSLEIAKNLSSFYEVKA